MEQSESFKKGQKEITKGQKKSWLNTNSKLDGLLNALNHDGSEKESLEQMQKRTEGTLFLSQKELVQLTQKLQADCYLVKESQGGTDYFYISTDGKVFIENGGYRGIAESKKINRRWTVTKTIVVAINGAVLLAIAVMTFYKDTNKTEQANKETILAYCNLIPSGVPMKLQTNIQGIIPKEMNSFQKASSEQLGLFTITDSIKKNEKYFQILDLYSTALRNHDADKNVILNNRGALKYSFHDYYGAIDDLKTTYKDDDLKLILGYCFIKTNQLDSANKYLSAITEGHKDLTESNSSKQDTSTNKSNSSGIKFLLPPLNDNYKTTVSIALYYKGLIDIFQERKAAGCNELSKASSLDTTTASYSYAVMNKLCR